MNAASVSLSAVNERVEMARADALGEMMQQAKEHTANVALLLNRLAESVDGLGSVPEETVQHLLRAGATFAAKGGQR